MAKNKRSAGEETAEAAGETKANGALLFEVMDEDFTMPAKLGLSEWDETVRKIQETEKGKKGFPIVKIFEVDAENLQTVYTRAKQLKQAAKRAEANITVAVRKLASSDPSAPVRHALLAQRNES